MREFAFRHPSTAAAGRGRDEAIEGGGCTARCNVWGGVTAMRKHYAAFRALCSTLSIERVLATGCCNFVQAALATCWSGPDFSPLFALVNLAKSLARSVTCRCRIRQRVEHCKSKST